MSELETLTRRLAKALNISAKEMARSLMQDANQRGIRPITLVKEHLKALTHSTPRRIANLAKSQGRLRALSHDECVYGAKVVKFAFKKNLSLAEAAKEIARKERAHAL